MEIFHMMDVISLLGLPGPPQGRSSYYVQCPCCDDAPRKRHLNINLKKDVFRCPRCGISGGIFDLYSLYTGVPRDKVRKALVQNLGTPEKPDREIKKSVSNPIVEYPVTDIESRHATYCALLAKLSLAQDHRQNLINRGLSDDDIIRLGYKTTPVVGYVGYCKAASVGRTLPGRRSGLLQNGKGQLDFYSGKARHSYSCPRYRR